MSLSVLIGTAATLLVMSASSGEAQSFKDTQQRLRSGDGVQVVTQDGEVVTGRFAAMSPSSMRLVKKGAFLELRAADIEQIRRVRREADGMLVGLGIGAAAGLSAVALRCQGASERTDCWRAGSLAVVAPSALAGALIDRAVRRIDTVFDRRAPFSKRVRISPILARRHKGVALSLHY